MVNPLAVPFAAMEAVVELPRTLRSVRRSTVLLQRAVDTAERLDERAETIVASIERAEATPTRSWPAATSWWNPPSGPRTSPTG